MPSPPLNIIRQTAQVRFASVIRSLANTTNFQNLQGVIELINNAPDTIGYKLILMGPS